MTPIPSDRFLPRRDAPGICLVDTFDRAASRFRSTGIMLVLFDRSSGNLTHHDEAASSDLRARVLGSITPGMGLVICSLASEGNTLIDPLLTPGLLSSAFPLSMPASVGASLPRCVVAAFTSDQAMSPEVLRGITQAISETFHDCITVSDDTFKLDSLTSHLADTYEELSLLYQVSSGMRVNRSPEEFFRAVCADVRTVLGARVVGVSIRPGRNRHNSFVVQGEHLDIDPSRLSRFVDETTELLVDSDPTRSGHALIVNNLAHDEPALEFLHPAFTRLLAVPLTRDEQVLGFLFAADKRSGGFDSVDAKLLSSVASTSAVYCENALLFEDLKGLTLGLLTALTSAIDAKDSYTCGHSERVAVLARLLALEAGLSREEAERIYISGLLHDVGKIGVPEEVLRKPGKLTEAEFEQMKLHPQIGARILADVRQVQDVIPGVLHHHERYDGRGYPFGLAARDIPLMGRILCIADSFDAMTTNRTYKRGRPLPQAIEEIARCAGSQFDPDLARVMVAIGTERISDTLEAHRARQPRSKTFTSPYTHSTSSFPSDSDTAIAA